MIRIIGYDQDQSSDLIAPDYSYASLPEEYFSFPGQVITTMDGDDVSDRFEAFVHAPFKGDCAAARNDTSLALRIILTEGTASGRILLMATWPTPRRSSPCAAGPRRPLVHLFFSYQGQSAASARISSAPMSMSSRR